MSEEEKEIMEKLKNGQQTTLLSSIRKCQQLKADNIFITRKEYIDTILALIDKLQIENKEQREDIIKLCAEIDDLKECIKSWKWAYKLLEEQNIKLINEQLKE